ncbi:MAG: thioredoxin domain-containing protein [Anaerolineae bacterium]
MEDKSKRKGKEESKGAGNRSRTIERRKERQREQRRQRQIWAAVGIAIVAVFVVVMIIISNLPAEAPIPDTALSNYEGLEFSRTAEGFPRIGNPSAPAQIMEYSSFDCPHCQEFHANVLPSILERVRAGEASFTYVPIYGTGGIANGEGAAKAAVCAAEQGGFFPFHDALFDWQVRYGNQAFTTARMGTGISNLGMDRGTFDACLRSDVPTTIVEAARTDASSIPDFTGTPFVQINGATVSADITSIEQAIAQAVALTGSTVPPTTVAPEATAEATTEATTEATVEATSEATTETTPTSEATPESTP